jgi:hypothetical protein
MLLARQARPAILADAPATPQAQRTEKRRPKICRFTPQPARDIRRRFRINMFHMQYVDTMHMHAARKIARKTSEKTFNLKGEMYFATETSLAVSGISLVEASGLLAPPSFARPSRWPRPARQHDLALRRPPLWRVVCLDILGSIVRWQSIQAQRLCLAAYRPARPLQLFDNLGHRKCGPQGDKFAQFLVGPTGHYGLGHGGPQRMVP